QFVEQVRLFKDFWAQHKDTDFGPRDEQYTNLWTDDLITGRECEMCGGPEGIKLYDEYIICRECFSTLLQYMYQLRSQYD
ncbi:MAG: hypothetical protein KKD77_21190, partial [Gammaproteobacteria bacterium]|nr:hypothetical protein [Gammaproteobacteria bacterium]